MRGASASATARSTQLRNSRTLPGQGYSSRACSADGSSRGRRGRTPSRILRHEPLCERQDSSDRSRSGGMHDRDHVYPIEQVLAEVALSDGGFEVRCLSRR